MTTFTKIEEDACPSISVDTDRILSEIKPEIYSGFTESAPRRPPHPCVTMPSFHIFCWFQSSDIWEDVSTVVYTIPEIDSRTKMASARTSSRCSGIWRLLLSDTRVEILSQHTTGMRVLGQRRTDQPGKATQLLILKIVAVSLPVYSLSLGVQTRACVGWYWVQYFRYWWVYEMVWSSWNRAISCTEYGDWYV